MIYTQKGHEGGSIREIAGSQKIWDGDKRGQWSQYIVYVYEIAQTKKNKKERDIRVSFLLSTHEVTFLKANCIV